MPGPRLILASSSSRRQELLREAGYEFEVDPAEVDENNFPAGMLPIQVATHLADAKARVVAERHVENVVLAADTVVAFGDVLLGKPADANHARRMIALLSGTTHLVITGVCVVNMTDNFHKTIKSMSAVRMKPLTKADIDAYIESNAWQGKAGGYGIQDTNPLVVKMSGSHSNVVGLPMRVTRQLLAEAGIQPVR